MGTVAPMALDGPHGGLTAPSWPTRLWTPSKVRLTVPLDSSQLVARLTEAGRGMDAPRGRDLGKVGYRVERSGHGFKLFKLGSILWYPPMPRAVLDATTSGTAGGSLIEARIRMPYPSVIMFCIFWLATAGTFLLPGGAFIAALVLWGGFGSLFTLALRADVKRGGPLMVDWLASALASPVDATPTEMPVAAAPGLGAPVPSELFPRRRDAVMYLAGLAGFWGGFLPFGLLLASHDPRLARNARLGPVEAVVFAVLIGGGILAMISTLRLQRRMSEHSVPRLTTQLRMAMPATIAEAGASLGLNGRLVAGVLYAVLIVGMASFFAGALLR